MNVTPRIFVSATSGDLRSHRAAVAAALKKLETYAEVQDDWPPDYRTVEALLRRRVKDCDAVIHLVGLRYGAEPLDIPPGVPRRSFTQMEYYIARELKKPVYLFLLPDTFPFDDGAEEDAERRALQAAHRERVLADAHLRYSPGDAETLQREVLSLQPLVDKLRTALLRARHRQAISIAAFLVVSAAISWALLREKSINTDQAKAITELQRAESAEVKLFKEIQQRRSEQMIAGGGSEPMSYGDALTAVAADHGLTPDALRGMLDNFSTRILSNPAADTYDRAVAEFHHRNFDSAITLATAAAEKAGTTAAEQRAKAIAAWTLAGDSWKEKLRYREALTAYQKALQQADKAGNPTQWTVLARNVALTHYELAAPGAAEPLLKEILALSETRYGPDSVATATDRNNLAHLYKTTGRFAEAEPLLRRALATFERIHGPAHPMVARCLGNLADVLQLTNRNAEAEPLLRRALAIDEAALGPRHQDVATDLNNLAQLLSDTNRTVEAESLMQRALQISEEALGGNHPAIAIRLNNLGNLLRETGRAKEAEPMFERAIKIDESVLGRNHPHVATGLNSLGALCHTAKRFPEAEQHFVRALAITESVYGKDHPDTGFVLNNLAQLFKETRRFDEAEPMMRRALAIGEITHGPNHPTVALRLNNLGALYQDSPRFAEAEPYLRRALEIFVACSAGSGVQDPNLETVINNYGGLLIQMGQTQAQAEEKVGRIIAPILPK